MVEYNCQICNYKTSNKTNFSKHNKTKKHMDKCPTVVLKNRVENFNPFKVNDMDNDEHISPHVSARKHEKTRENCKKQNCTAICKYCHTTLSNPSSLMRHLLKCPEKFESDDIAKQKTEIAKLKEKINNQKKEINNHKKEINNHISEKKYYRELINNYSTFGPKTFNSITYVMNKYENAPHIKTIEPKKLECFQNINLTTVENMISDYTNDTFVNFIIKAITTLHKKDNPEIQSIWSTDTSRYNYIIKELLENKGSYWVVDKKGTKSKTYLVEPILKFIRDEIIVYNNKACYLLLDKDLPKMRFAIITSTQRYGAEMIKEIDNGDLAKDIIKKLAKHLHHKASDIDLPLIEEIDD